MKLSLFFCCMLAGCSFAPQSSRELVIPYEDLSGPTPPVLSAPASLVSMRSQKNVLDTHLFQNDPKKACLNFLEAQLFSRNPLVIRSALYSYTILQIPPPEEALTKLLDNDNPALQLSLLMTLSETASPLLIPASQQAMMSDFPLIQLYGARFLTKLKTSDALTRIESLEAKLPSDCLPYIAELYALEGSPQAQKRLLKLISSGSSDTVSQCLCLIRLYHLMELFPLLSTYQPMNPQEAEALAFALASLETTPSETQLINLSHHRNPSVAIQALYSLNELGRGASMRGYTNLIDTQSPFVFSILGKTPFSTEEIASLWPLDMEWSSRFGLSLSLLERRSPLSLPFLFQAIQECDQTVYERTHSLSGTCFFVTRKSKTAACTQEAVEEEYESDVLMEMLIRTIDISFPEEFEAWAETILLQGPPLLASSIIGCFLENSSTKRIEILKQVSSHSGRPFVRQMALFCLIQLKEASLEEDALRVILKNQRECLKTLIRHSSPFFLFHEDNSLKNQKRMSEQQKLYFAAIALLAQTKTETSSSILREELQEASEEYRTLIAAALLHSLL